MTTITPDGTPDGTPVAGNCSSPRPSLRPGPVVPGTLTAVSHADQSPKAQHAEKGGPGTYPGAPRPETVRPTPLADLAEQLGCPAPEPGQPGAGTGSTGAAAAAQPVMVTGITHDSRAVRPGDVYAALPGARLHGADFVAQAADLGAAAILTDPSGAERAAATGLPALVVENPRARMGSLAVSIYGAPGEDLLQIGITGTSGKTTTAYLIEGGLRAAAAKRADGGLTGLIGTVETRIGDERIKSERTTPEATDLQALFAVMRERGVRAVAMEVSSHALVLGRVDGCVFDVAIFNNLSPEHMEFHSGMEDYFQAKAQLFTKARSRAGVVNLDDEYGKRLAEGESEVPVTTFSAEGHPDADWRASDVEVGALGSTFTVHGPDGRTLRAASPIAGPFNVANALAAIVSLVVAGIDPQTAADGVAAVPGVPGRLERIDAGQPYLAVVDYAHKTDAVESVLRALRKVTDGKLHAVLGCGGDRDPHKRGPMGAAVARLADTAILTSDNPRGEDPLSILATMLAGAAEVPIHERGTVLVEEERATAIAAAVARAEPGDTVIVAGKGHEQGQDIAGVVRPFDDRQVLRDAIEGSLKSQQSQQSPQPNHQG
ncbi:UDP-N-acetylmuramoyl-L-alanyl-D-glutamate--2,6-diaminopimelate ligase [Streptomyces sp. 2112.3]|uniref:UDP-N-acetylmuramoyl-L-alanyl-D-glutamate--2, 6-diaminopimelate ligase n=1 Tax=unclassified Streptomyces TaxID=2593676 RepID=UPI0008875E00|nr:UDP-N-acetylmuramoylalanyl-D-glutamate--2,6-diaminopimelate ligase [Streptomyces sp. 2321.6]SDR52519.1 UDP-N-acetylmuramoylalanyl-D-glutamate--2,6-diaminopimelate ligase [Streptomyces sp. KS_16]SEC35569.1 UDP-N-acetylmuramoylalanyl-D-glutamate--2,6-diaminopimelate ligase [Streptomyces sp. 2133.1]SEF04151.1 UDP-N-acetylmuramoylalanyl-D-glutamate--2,6-diaminopimelate ligase [Streptomyces sp. 2112.3]SNC66862.1 UDP-N-acetylmuramoylalanyl-D-glutamate--2,6-diaminopimelate ligase [Streptomyces sp. 